MSVWGLLCVCGWWCSIGILLCWMLSLVCGVGLLLIFVPGGCGLALLPGYFTPFTPWGAPLRLAASPKRNYLVGFGGCCGLELCLVGGFIAHGRGYRLCLFPPFMWVLGVECFVVGGLVLVFVLWLGIVWVVPCILSSCWIYKS